jgi:tRNA(Ile)-lysidine synthase
MPSPQSPPPRPTDPWSQRWAGLARAAGLRPTEPVAIALSGGADSIFLLHALARAAEKPRVLAIHVDHGLRDQDSQDDAAFCARTAARLQVSFARLRVELDPNPSGLEERARHARYEALVEETQNNGLGILLTGHHEDDALETLLQRWTRGSDLAGLPGLKRRYTMSDTSGRKLTVVRPLLPLRREEVRQILVDAQIEWREDATNQDQIFTRNRIREGLLPALNDASEGQAIDGLRAFASAVESLEGELASCTAHITWSSRADLTHSSDPALGSAPQRIERTRISALPTPLQRRTLWRLIQEGCGGAPSRSLLDGVTEDLSAGRLAKHTLPGGWLLELSRHELSLLRPPLDPDAEPNALEAPWTQSIPLVIDGTTMLPDGRRLTTSWVETPGDQNHPSREDQVELDSESLPDNLLVRLPQAGDRFQALGAPGKRKLTRFLSDAGIAREQRAQIPLVLAGEEIIWVAGVRPGDRHRLREVTRRRLRLTIEPAGEGTTPISEQSERILGPSAVPHVESKTGESV